jgi:hypothetical protein
MDCGTPPGGAAAAVGESVEWEEEAAEMVRRGGREAMAAWRLGESRHGDRDLGSKANPEKRRELGCGGRLAVRSVVWAGGRRAEQREGNVACFPVFFHSSSF